jgi:hypothetical protein
MATFVQIVRRTSEWHRPLVYFSALMVVMTVVSTAGVLFDDRLLVGVPIWLKPLKFAISMFTYCLTWAWLISKLPVARRPVWWVSTVMTGLFAFEYVLLLAQTIRGRMIHFNFSTPVDRTFLNLMAGSAFGIMAMTIVLALIYVFARVGDRPTRWAIRLGAFISIAGMAVGTQMGSTPKQKEAKANGTWDGISGAHSVGVDDGGPGLPLTAWSTEGGDMRVAHMVGIHGLQAVPLLLMAIIALSAWFPRLRLPQIRTRLVIVFGLGYLGLFALTFWQAKRAEPLVHPGAQTLTALAAGIGFVALACWLAVAVPVRREQPVLSQVS